MQSISPMMISPTSSPYNKLVRITSTLFLNTTQVATMTVDPSAIQTIDEDIKEYSQELKLIIDLEKEVQGIHTDNIDYTQYISIIKDNLQNTNKAIRILEQAMINALTLQAIELPYPAEYSRDRKGILNFISKMYSKLVRQNGCFLDN
jgi:hypothetical protein